MLSVSQVWHYLSEYSAIGHDLPDNVFAEGLIEINTDFISACRFINESADRKIDVI